jgi:geranylgeranyl pyrophosphate synthase
VSALAALRALGGPGLPDFLAGVEARLSAAVAVEQSPVAAAGADTLRSGGKRLRPTLVYLTAPPAERGRPELAAAGCAVELVHMATLVHDDQLDGSLLRRGQPTVWKAHGELVSSATGDYLFARAFSELSATADMEAVSFLARACLSLALGEARQREQSGQPETTVEQYLERCALKTGRLFAAAAMLGGHLGGAGHDATRRLGEFGEALGLAFQLADDILDCDGQPDTTGKPLGTDLLEGTITLPMILAAQRDPEVAAVLRRGAAPADVLLTLARIARSGAVADARVVARRYAKEAAAKLSGLDAIVDTGALRVVLRSAVERDA